MSKSEQILNLPRLYPILDTGLIAARVSAEKLTSALCSFALELVTGGATLIQFRAKKLPPAQWLFCARELKRVVPESVVLFMNDRPDLCLAAGFDGVHVGQDDLSPKGVRAVVGNRCWIGLSTHYAEQVQIADQAPVDYIAIGPVFGTQTKENPDPVVGLEGVRKARQLTQKPLVAIGGINRKNARSVLEAGADSVAVIGDLLDDPRAAVEDFLRELV